jgi:hypothetical protein
MHPLEDSASMTFQAAREGLDEAFSYLGSTDQTDRRRMRVALAGVAAACDAVKATANAYANVIGHVSRQGPQPEPGGDQ